jgi:rod shape-determining protein MreC
MRSSRLIVFGVALFFCLGLFSLSVSGILLPLQGVLNIPISAAQGFVTGTSRRVSTFITDLANYQSLQARNEQYEAALFSLQAELVDLREIKSDYDRIRQQLDYVNKSSSSNRQYKTAEVIGRDTTGLLRTITLNLGTRDGVLVGMPVVTEIGLVGRISSVASSSAQVRLIIDTNSFVNARLQETRAEGRVSGSVVGTASGDLRMTFIPLGERVQDGDVVVTSGIGGNFPRGLIIGQVISTRLDDSKLFQEAQVRTLVNFNRLEFVLVITNFEPVDLASFGTPVPR